MEINHSIINSNSNTIYENKKHNSQSIITSYDIRTADTDLKSSRIGNLIKKNLSVNDLTISDFNVNYEAFFKQVNFLKN